MSTPLVEQKPFNGHTPLPWPMKRDTWREPWSDEYKSDQRLVDDKDRTIIDIPYEDQNGVEDESIAIDNADFAHHAIHIYYQREAELQSMRDRMSRMEEAGNAMAKQMKFWADYMGETGNQRGEEMVTKTIAAWNASLSNK